MKQLKSKLNSMESISEDDSDFFDDVISFIDEDKDFWFISGKKYDTGNVASEVDSSRVSKELGIIPKVGDTLRVWTNMGHYTRGIAINGQIVFYSCKESIREGDRKMSQNAARRFMKRALDNAPKPNGRKRLL